jgi:hypothetical protein
VDIMVSEQVTAVRNSADASLQPCLVMIDASMGSLLPVTGGRKDATGTMAIANAVLKDLCGAGMPEGGC